ncbi:hypothetical protein SAMN05443575_1736 [Jatrophihabitans endophyticus]|uniref:Uncharacterized protein n=1 Tax=Jatrophihabitans endophyticus TaxID=1206085 RepID=A0A1M5I327_9ACTN|nr:hypothetical protein [Jatrophihabitans endophyticus]SHG22686.1 hypothetical protein SAMN05443575_1736 [Jatrophihabitans endophyticus]
MRAILRGAARRGSHRARLAVGRRYRVSLERDSPELRAYLLVGATLARAVRLRETLRSGSWSSLEDVTLALSRRTHRARRSAAGELELRGAAVSGGGELSLSLAGPTDRCADVHAVAFSTPTETVEVAAFAVPGDRAVRLVAPVPPAVLAGATAELRVVTGRRSVDVFVTSRDTLADPPGAPARLALARDGRLRLLGALSGGPFVAHSLAPGLRTLEIGWDGTGEAALRLDGADGERVELAGTVGADGRRRVSVPLGDLVRAHPVRWLAAVGGSAAGTWTPLRQPLDARPLHEDTAAFLVRTDDGVADVATGYAEDNVLRISTGPPR